MILSGQNTQVIGTPVIGDFNLDGHLDISYSVMWRPATFHAVPMTTVFTFTLEDRFNELYQPDGEVKGQVAVNFDLFLPSDRQPWNKYMGCYGNNTFKNSIH